MMIENVELFNGRVRQTKEIDLSSSKIEFTIKNYDYSGEGKERDREVENLKMPSMALCFYSYVFKKGVIPTEEEFINFYLSHHAFIPVDSNNIIVSYNGITKKVSRSGIEARLLRTYPSIIRDIHFYYLLSESKLFDGVYYSFENDYYNMIDIKVLYKEKWFNIGLLYDSYNSEQYREKKQKRHSTKEEVLYIKLSRDKCKRCGKFYLYTEEHVKELYNTIVREEEG